MLVIARTFPFGVSAWDTGVRCVRAQAAPATAKNSTTVMREVEYARRKRGRLGGWWKVLCTGLILVCCVGPGISLEGLANAAPGIYRTLSADPCDTLQEVRRKNKDLRKELSKLPWPELRCFSAEGCTHSLPL